MADKGTSTDLTPAKHVDEVAAKNFDLDKFLVKLQLEEPFFCKVLRKVTKVKTDAIPRLVSLLEMATLRCGGTHAF